MNHFKRIVLLIQENRKWVIISICILNLAISFSVFNSLRLAQQDNFEKSFNNLSKMSKYKIIDKLVYAETSLRMMKDFFHSGSEHVEYFKNLKYGYPVFHVLEWIPKISVEEITKFEQVNGVKIDDSAKTIDGKKVEKDFIMPLLYSVPSERAVEKVGRDFSNDSKIYALFERAANNGVTQVSFPFKGNKKRDKSFRIVIPVYDFQGKDLSEGMGNLENLSGILAGYFYYSDIISQSLRLFQKNYIFWLFDITEEDDLVCYKNFTSVRVPEALIQQDKVLAQDIETYYRNYYKNSYTFIFYGRKFKMFFVSDQTDFSVILRKWTILIPLIILLLGFLCAYIMWEQLKRNRLIEQLVEKKTLTLSKINKILATSQSQFESLVKNMPSITYRCYVDDARTMFYISPYVEEILGYSPREFTDSRTVCLGEIIHPEDADRVQTVIRDSVSAGIPWTIEYRIKGSNSEFKWVYEKGQAVLGEKGKAKFCDGFILDISKRKEAEQKKIELEIQLAQSQKLEAIGVLAAGIAHEINTPVQYVNDYVSFVGKAVADLFSIVESYRIVVSEKMPQEIKKLKSMEDDIDLEFLKEEMPQAIANSQEGLERITTIVRAMRDFSHVGVEGKKVIADVNKAIESTITITKNEWKYVAEMETDFDPAAGAVSCYIQELKQVVLNLIINASHAIKEKIGEQSSEKGVISIKTKKKDKALIISISDTGIGIARENRAKIFDQFFTTKDVGKGTGQGLAMAYAVIVNKHGGKIDFTTKENEGTEFTIVIPIEE